MNKNNYHTHTTRCYHASGKDEEYVKAAIKAGIKELGFSDHTPWHYDSSFKATMRMPESQLDDYIESIRYLKEKYKDQISILIGLECEYFERYMPWLEKMLKDKQIDYIILGNHYYETDELHQYFGSPVNEYYLKAYVDHCIKAIDTGLYSYIAHPDLVYYDKDSKLYQEEMSRLCAYAKEKDMPLEFNLLGFMSGRHYPNESFWKIASKYKNKAIIGFDAHSPDALLKDDIYQQAFNYLSSLDVELIDTIKTLKKYGQCPYKKTIKNLKQILIVFINKFNCLFS